MRKKRGERTQTNDKNKNYNQTKQKAINKKTQTSPHKPAPKKQWWGGGNKQINK